MWRRGARTCKPFRPYRVAARGALNMFAIHMHAKRVARGTADAVRALRSRNVVAQSDGSHNSTSQRCFADGPSFDYEPDYGKRHDIVRKHGVDVLHDPLYNKVCGLYATRACTLQSLTMQSAYNAGNWLPPCREREAWRQRPATAWHPFHGETGW